MLVRFFLCKDEKKEQTALSISAELTHGGDVGLKFKRRIVPQGVIAVVGIDKKLFQCGEPEAEIVLRRAVLTDFIINGAELPLFINGAELPLFRYQKVMTHAAVSGIQHKIRLVGL